ncbi:hypothetical protein QFZ77_006366 [Paenibacillus sp. V4I3]|nr:hypothetical protein [Paenibacillus sp. V4I3]MDQ0886418.1 hypothetical protein [Paenibacillus sp. V4I9]
MRIGSAFRSREFQCKKEPSGKISRRFFWLYPSIHLIFIPIISNQIIDHAEMTANDLFFWNEAVRPFLWTNRNPDFPLSALVKIPEWLGCRIQFQPHTIPLSTFHDEQSFQPADEVFVSDAEPGIRRTFHIRDRHTWAVTATRISPLVYPVFRRYRRYQGLAILL